MHGIYQNLEYSGMQEGSRGRTWGEGRRGQLGSDHMVLRPRSGWQKEPLEAIRWASRSLAEA